MSSIGDSVQTQLKSYSEAVQGQASTNCSELFNSNVLKAVVKDVVAEEDRRRNLLIFGLTEEPEVVEQISEKDVKVIEVIDEKPRFEANRIGKKTTQQKPRLVKVSMSNATTVNQILSKERKLSVCEQYKHVFVSPDRTKEERDEHQDLVKQLKTKRSAEPDKRFYI